MRQGSNPKRLRGRNGRKSTNPRSQSFESNGPEVKVRGNAQQVVEKYLALARDAATAGDRIRSESYFQHAEHYYRLMNANGGYENRENPSRSQGGDDHGEEAQPGVESAAEVDNSRGDVVRLTNGSAEPVPDPASAPQPDPTATPAAQAE
jgi:hypothetical protein